MKIILKKTRHIPLLQDYVLAQKEHLPTPLDYEEECLLPSQPKTNKEAVIRNHKTKTNTQRRNS